MPRIEARAQLDRILGSEAFARAPQLRRFLVYVVEEALAGQAGRLKEYTLGLEVFDRGADFDPRTDPIVRVDARRLRARLQSYYENEGAGDPIEIALAKGSYAPRFRRRAPVRPATARIEPVRLAVLPLQSIGGGLEDEAFAEGLGEELMLALARRPELRVIGSASSSRFRGQPRDLPDIGRRLDARLILEGKVRRQGRQLRITVTLSTAVDSTQVWSERYDAAIAEAEEVFALQDRMAQQIVERMAPRVHEVAAAGRRPTRDLAAYELYLRGRHQLNMLSPTVLSPAIGFLEAALARDSGFALAQAALAEAHFARAVYLLAPPAEAMAKARELARAALAIAPGLTAGHLWLAVLSAVLDHDFRDAADGFARALSRDPLNVEARRERACWLLAPLGRLEEAAAELRDLLASDPYSLRLRVDYARILLFQRRYDEAIAQFTMVLDMEPGHGPAAHFLAAAYEHSGELTLARAAHERQARQFPYPLVADWLAAASALWDGDRGRAAAIVDRMEATVAQGPAAATVLADIHQRLGAFDRAVAWLERAADERLFRVVYLDVDPDYDPLRETPRFQKLLRRVGLGNRRRAAAAE